MEKYREWCDGSCPLRVRELGAAGVLGRRREVLSERCSITGSYVGLGMGHPKRCEVEASDCRITGGMVESVWVERGWFRRG